MQEKAELPAFPGLHGVGDVINDIIGFNQV